MGTFLFKPLNEDEVTKVAFTFIFTEINNSIKIKVHHSLSLLDHRRLKILLNILFIRFTY